VKRARDVLLAAGTAVALAALLVVPSPLARAADGDAKAGDRVTAGLAVWRNSGCPDCHGAFADGEKQRDEMPTGANLRTTRLDARGLKETISCGRPGTGMPSFDDDAWTVRACGGATPGPRPDDLFPAPVLLGADEIDAVIAYLQAHVIGRGRTVSKQECLFYYGDDPGWCEDR
jgi:mono/diheme cytochrome c family protein